MLNNKRGFIQIPILIAAIIVGIVAVSSAGYIAYKNTKTARPSQQAVQTANNSDNQNDKFNSTEQEFVDPRDQEIQDLREEIEKLKNSKQEENPTTESRVIEKVVEKPVIVYQSAPGSSNEETVPEVISAPSPTEENPLDLSKTDFSSYKLLENIRVYTKNPLQYSNKLIRFKNGLVVDIAPAINSTDSSYIHLIDNTGNLFDPGEMVIKITDTKEFNRITSNLEVGDLVEVWGLGTESEEFIIIDPQSGPYKKYKPVVIMHRLTNCYDTPYDCTLISSY
jgi:Tfp pilus assembly protein PilE